MYSSNTHNRESHWYTERVLETKAKILHFNNGIPEPDLSCRQRSNSQEYFSFQVSALVLTGA